MPQSTQDYPFEPVPFTRVVLTGGLLQERQRTNRSVTFPLAIARCEDSGRLGNFERAAEVMRRRAAGEHDFQIAPPTQYPFDDTDIYKVIEAASYELSSGSADPTLPAVLDRWIACIRGAQEPDGYLYTFRTMHPDSPAHEWSGQERWLSEPELSHELYNSGHLFEAGAAHFNATGSRALLDICLKNAELLWRELALERRRIAPGHPLVEMGLAKLYRATNDTRWLELARTFLDNRGPGGNCMYQLHERAADQREAVGHAVRANYLYSGMTDVAALLGASDYHTASRGLWDNVVSKKLYLTGGVGARVHGEAYGADYELPSNGYCETCAAIALMTWSHRMFLLEGDTRYMDVFERALFNAFLSGVSLSGDHFFYSSPLSYDARTVLNEHLGRAPWFGCACCPPNLMRTLASLTGYFYAVREDALYLNLYSANRASLRIAGTDLCLEQVTDYPWQGSVRIQVEPAAAVRFALHLRIPGWARGEPVPSDLYRYEQPAASWRVQVNGEEVPQRLERGYVVISREWRAGDVLDVQLDMPVRRVLVHEHVAAIRGRVAFERGPVVHAVEQMDAAGSLDELCAPASTRVSRAAEDPLPNIPGLAFEPLDRPEFRAIPYFGWNNRGLVAMSVWLLGSPAAP